MRAFTVINHYPIKFLNGSANAIVRRLGLEPQEELRSARSWDKSSLRWCSTRPTGGPWTPELPSWWSVPWSSGSAALARS